MKETRRGKFYLEKNRFQNVTVGVLYYTLVKWNMAKIVHLYGQITYQLFLAFSTQTVTK